MKKLFYFDKEKCCFETIKPKGYLPGLGVLVVVFGLGWISNSKVVTRMLYGKNDTIVVRSTEFSEQALIEMLMDCNVKYPHIVLAQAKLESGHFTSKIFKQNHNMFGMRKAHQRITSAQDEKDTYAFYRDWMDCVYDYAMYQSSVMCSVSNENEYFAKLGARYAEDPMYVTRLKAIIEKEKLKTIFEE
jgi:hypothetical protein